MFELLIIIFILTVAIFIIKNTTKQLTAKPEQIKFNFKVFFINGYCNYNPVKLQQGECKFKVENGMFYFEQNGQIIKDNIFDIYNIRTWTYENYVYIAIRMKTSSEYKFSLSIKSDVESSIEKALLLSMLKMFENLCKKLKIDFVDCGESGNDETTEDDE